MLLGVVDELLFGHRPDPLGAATDVVGNIGDDPVLALRAIRTALVLPYAEIGIDGVQVATSGSRVTHTRRLALDLGDSRQGELVLGLRAGDLRLSAGDEQALRLVAPLLAQTLRASSLAADLQVSREATVTALEDERRRLRRDLHDGLGPRLSGIAFTADAARNSLHSDLAGAEALLLSVRAETTTAIDEIRRLVYAMRPPALDELGLVPALRQQAEALRTKDGSRLHVTIAADEIPTSVTAAAEVAAYRIVMEALTNVARHSGCDTASVRLRVECSELVIDVTDSGTVKGPWSTGVGLASMRERAAQMGGTLTAGSDDSGGRVHATVPL
jgi:signal transduction histidine kinase